MQMANEELRARNTALLTRFREQEEELWRIKSAASSLHPSEHVAAYPPRAAEPADGSSDAITGTLWQFLDIAVDGAVRARADMRRAQAETLIALDKAFGPLEKDARIKARALIAQSSRASTRLLAACQQLESEAASAREAHESDVAAWVSRMRLMGSRMAAQREAVSTTLLLELERMEREHAAHAHQMASEADGLRVQVAQAKGWSEEEVRTLSVKLAEARRRVDEMSSSSSSAQSSLTSENSRLRQQLALLQSELSEERGRRATEQQTNTLMMAELQKSNASLRRQLSEVSVEFDTTRTELHGELNRLQQEKERHLSDVQSQMGLLVNMKEEEAANLRDSVAKLKVERHRTQEDAAERIRTVQAEREADAHHLHAKIERLRALHTAALAAGSVRGRQLLYAESLKSPGVLRKSSMTWRGEDWRSSPGRSSSASVLESP